MAAVGERRARSPPRIFFMPPSCHLSCSLCDDNFTEVVLPCGHTFCRACVVRWFERQRTCPECRANIPPGAPLPTNWTVRAQVDELRVRCRFGLKEEGDALIRTLKGHTSSVLRCAFSPDGRSICSGSYDKSLKLWDAATGACQRTLDGHTNKIRCCAYSADGATVLSGSDDNTLKLWSVATGACIRTFTGHTHYVMSCCFSHADGNTILSGSGDETLKLWDATTGIFCRRTLTGHTGGVLGCAFSPIDGNALLSCSFDKRLKLWDAATGECTSTLEGHNSPVFCCAFSPDGATIASGDRFGTLKVWRRV